MRHRCSYCQVLVQNQCPGELAGEYHFPVWDKVMKAAGIVRQGEEVVRLHPSQLGGHAELRDLRMMALVTSQRFKHVVAVVRGEEAGEVGHFFRLYDNDGRERRQGWGRMVTTEELAGSDCMMHAVVKVGLEVHARASVPRVVPRMGWARQGTRWNRVCT